jgi:catechol 2,3-dioxygenase-like lactoylglutathione lyase family enzyme
MQVSQTIPMFRIFDLSKAREFYLSHLGFRLDWEHRFEPELPVYMQVSRDGLTLHLTEHHGDCCPGAAAFVWISGLDDLHRELRSRQYNYLRPGIEDEPWGRVMKVIDPFGNRILFAEKPGA